MNATPDEEIGQRLQQVRERKNLNQSQAVRALREAGLVWSQGTLSKVESGNRPIRLAELPAIATAFGVSQNELLAPEDPISSALERMRIVESTAQEAYSNFRFRYLSAATARRSIQLLAELSEGRPGPYTVSYSSARFLRYGLHDEFSGAGISPEDALARMGVAYVAVQDDKVETEEDFEALKATLPADYQPLFSWVGIQALRGTPDNAGREATMYLPGMLTDVAMGKALEDRFPQVSFIATDEPRLGYHNNENLVITGIREPDDA